MSARTIQRTRTNAWQSSIAASSAVAFSVSTNDPSAAVVAAPIPTLTIRFGGKPGAAFVLRDPAPASRRRADPPEAPPPQAEPKFSPSGHAIELIIDSLPHYELTEPIPVTIDPLGDAVFTAAVRNLDITATGNSIGEALLLLKDQIEFTYEELNRRLAQLSYEQRTMLQMLHTYIAPHSAKPDEF
jgi:hypothetical protein